MERNTRNNALNTVEFSVCNAVKAATLRDSVHNHVPFIPLGCAKMKKRKQ